MPRIGKAQGQTRAERCIESYSPRIPIGDDGSQVVDVRHLGAFLWRCLKPRIIMLPIMQLLRTEETMDLIRNRGVRVISISSRVKTREINAKTV